ncbi:MAG: SH3 domain-containing protein [Acutalibacteraceae bacterium]
MKCSYCGKNLPENADFCPQCGMIISMADDMGDSANSVKPEDNVFKAMDFDEEISQPAMELEADSTVETAPVVENIAENVTAAESPVLKQEPVFEPPEYDGELIDPKKLEAEAAAKKEAENQAKIDAALQDSIFKDGDDEDASDITEEMPAAETETAKDAKAHESAEQKEASIKEVLPVEASAEEALPEESLPEEASAETAIQPEGAPKSLWDEQDEAEAQQVEPEDMTIVVPPVKANSTEEYPAYDLEENGDIPEKTPKEDDNDSLIAALFDKISENDNKNDEIEDITESHDSVNINPDGKKAKGEKKSSGWIISLIAFLVVILIGGYLVVDKVLPIVENGGIPVNGVVTGGNITDGDVTENDGEEKVGFWSKFTALFNKQETTEEPTTTKPTTTVPVTVSPATTNKNSTTAKNSTTSTAKGTTSTTKGTTTTTKGTTTTTKSTTTTTATTAATTTKAATTQETTYVRRPSSYNVDDKEIFVLEDGVNFRYGPSTSYGRIRMLYADTRLIAYAKENGFYYVYCPYYDSYGWISADYAGEKAEETTTKATTTTKPAETTTKPTTTNPTTTKPAETTYEPYNETYTAYVTADIGLYIRSGPGTSYSIIGSIKLDGPVKVLGYSKTQSGWVYIEDINYKTKGWVSADYIEKR